jgi:uncharacterized protein YaiE (UPF0345 family)
MAKKAYVNDGTDWVELASSNTDLSGYLLESSASTTYATKTELNNIDLSSASAAAVAAIVDSAPSTLNTLNELAAALGDDANYASTITTSLGNKLDSTTAASTYAPIVPTTQTGFRNVLINGDMKIDQRRSGSSFNVPGAGGVYTYATDRWFAYSSNTQALTQRLYASGSYYTRIAVNSSLTALTLGQRIESINSYHLAGKTVTLSFRMSSTASSVTWAASYANTTDTFGTQASPTVTSITSGTVTPTSSFANYSVTFSIPSDATTGLQVTFTTESEFGINLQLTNVQLELGSTATPFEQRPIGVETDLCKRYYQNYSSQGYYGYIVRNGVKGTQWTYSPEMRATPSTLTTSYTVASSTKYGFSGYAVQADGSEFYTSGPIAIAEL